MAIARSEILRRVRAEVAAGRPVVGCGAGAGISAKSAEAGGGGPHHHLQPREVPHGGPRLAGRSHALRRRQRDRHRDGRRGASRGDGHAGSGRSLRHRSVPPHAGVPEAAEGDRLFGHPELPDGRAHRRRLPQGPGSHRNGIRQRGRSHPHRTPDGSVHRPVCLRRTPGGDDGRGGRGHARSPTSGSPRRAPSARRPP